MNIVVKHTSIQILASFQLSELFPGLQGEDSATPGARQHGVHLQNSESAPSVASSLICLRPTLPSVCSFSFTNVCLIFWGF